MKRRARRFLLGALLLTGAACAQTPPNMPNASDAILSRIRLLIGDAACTSASQCQVLPVGARPCGGPDSFLAWSTQRTDAAALMALAKAHAVQRQREDDKSGRQSTCEVLPTPLASCLFAEAGQAGRCTLQATTGNAAAIR